MRGALCDRLAAQRPKAPRQPAGQAQWPAVRAQSGHVSCLFGSPKNAKECLLQDVAGTRRRLTAKRRWLAAKRRRSAGSRSLRLLPSNAPEAGGWRWGGFVQERRGHSSRQQLWRRDERGSGSTTSGRAPAERRMLLRDAVSQGRAAMLCTVTHDATHCPHVSPQDSPQASLPLSPHISLPSFTPCLSPGLRPLSPPGLCFFYFVPQGGGSPPHLLPGPPCANTPPPPKTLCPPDQSDHRGKK